MDIFVLLFSFFLILLAIGINKNWKVKSPLDHNYSIIIPCRDESENLPSLFKALDRISYPENRFEIILVNDASQDDSLSLIQKFCSERKNASYLSLTEKNRLYKGKKAALQSASKIAKFEFLLFLDADCFPQKNILQSYDTHITENRGLIVGNYRKSSFLSFEHFIDLMTAAINSATIGLGIPFSASGGNLLLRKKTFEEIGGYEKVKNQVAGDDKLLLKLVNETKWKIAYNADQIVETKNTKDKKHRHEQKKRKFGKLGMSSTFFKFLSFLILLFYLYFPFRLLTNFVWKEFLLYYASALVFWLINLQKHKAHLYLVDFWFLLVYPYYLIVYSVWGMFGKWHWKRQSSN